MNYRNDKHGNPLSILGFGCMRFPRKGTAIDMAETEAEIMTAFRAGVNYYVTAYNRPCPGCVCQWWARSTMKPAWRTSRLRASACRASMWRR